MGESGEEAEFGFEGDCPLIGNWPVRVTELYYGAFRLSAFAYCSLG
jgi:hypothetical protein